jgi:hypothetical protein
VSSASFLTFAGTPLIDVHCLSWLLVWSVILVVTVIVQRRRKETERMKSIWEEMKKKEGQDA